MFINVEEVNEMKQNNRFILLSKWRGVTMDAVGMKVGRFRLCKMVKTAKSFVIFFVATLSAISLKSRTRARVIRRVIDNCNKLF